MASVYVKSRNLLDRFKYLIYTNQYGATDLLLENGKKYTISCFSKLEDLYVWIDVRPENSHYSQALSNSYCRLQKNGEVKTTLKIPNDGIKYCIGVGAGGTPTTKQFKNFFNNTYCTNLMVAEGDYSEYEPYGAIEVIPYIKNNGIAIPVKSYLRGE